MILKVFSDMNDSVILWSAAVTPQWKLSHHFAQLKQKAKFLFPGVLLATSHGLFWNDLHTSAWNPSKPGWFLYPAWHFSARLCVTLTANFLSAHSETTVGCDQSSYLGTKSSLYTEKTCQECQRWPLLLLKYSMEDENSINTVHRHLHWLPIPHLSLHISKDKVPWDAGHKTQHTFPSLYLNRSKC